MTNPITRIFNFFDQQIVSDDGLKKINLSEITFIEDFKKYVFDHPNIIFKINRTEGLSEVQTQKMDKIIENSQKRVSWNSDSY